MEDLSYNIGLFQIIRRKSNVKKLVIFLCACSLIILFEGTLFADPIYNPATNHWYDIVEGPTWEQAEANAQALNGHLVTISNQQEQDWLINNFDIEEYGYLWIGFNDIEQEGTWVWSSGQEAPYTNWAGGEPNNNGDEDFAVMNWIEPGLWNDLPNSYGNIRGIAEWSSTPVPVGANPVLIIFLIAGIISIVIIGKKILANNE